jgi:putative SOS response-associated peptidase YedK
MAPAHGHVRRVCTAYEFGGKGLRVPERWKLAVAEHLRAWMETRIVRPTHVAPVFLPQGEIRDMSWGFRRAFRGSKGPVKRSIVNSREDKLDSPMWREAFLRRRCLIPVRAYFEWTENPRGQAIPLRFVAEEEEDWLVIAGIWEETESGPCFSMITTEPSPWVRAVHDRMPALLTPGQFDPFLQGELMEFGPSPRVLCHAPVPNFLQTKAPPPAADDQGLLF